ncbi:MAG: hypothetical protein GY811_00900 [Myxococcales bacterium]|nr:hypothetical protein [Myxococcales bacterium]
MQFLRFTSPLLLLTVAALPSSAFAEDTGPDLELPAEEETAEKVVQAPANSVTIGGYGELHYTRVDPEDGQVSNEIDMHRMVLYVGRQFSDRISFSSEIEVEHAIVGDGKVGEVSVEQAVIDYRFTDPSDSAGVMGMRAGIMLVPMGIVNIWHEPNTFHGVERPNVDKVIIPSTWREGGVSFYHKPTEQLSYEAGIMGGLNPLKFSAKSGIRGGRQKVGEARTDGLAFTARGQFSPTGQTVLGVSGYYSMAGKNADVVDADVAVLGVSADARGKFEGFEAKAEFAMFTIGDTDVLNAVTDGAGDPITDVADTIMGTYAELAYDVFHTMDMDEQLLPFARLEYYDTDPDDDTRTIVDIVAGLTFRPIPQVAFKGDVVFRRKGGDVDGDNSTLLNLGVGFLY